MLDGFGKSLEVILPKLREGFVAPDSYTARSLALSHPHAFFLSPTGETFHNVTVTGGRPRAQGPLALKRELTEVLHKLEQTEQELAQADISTTELQRQIAELNAAVDSKTLERRDSEREAANSGAALRQMESETARIERRLQEWSLATERNRDARNQKADLIAKRQQETAAFEAERAGLESSLAELQSRLDELRSRREGVAAGGGGKRQLRWRGSRSGAVMHRRTSIRPHVFTTARANVFSRLNSRSLPPLRKITARRGNDKSCDSTGRACGVASQRRSGRRKAYSRGYRASRQVERTRSTTANFAP